MLVTSILSFSHNVFKLLKDKNHHLKYFYFVVCKCKLDQSKIVYSILGSGLKTNVEVCRKHSWKTKGLGKGRKFMTKGENGGNQHFVLFPQICSFSPQQGWLDRKIGKNEIDS